jgi:hypothetical protein
MTDLRQRFGGLDRLATPDLWSEIELRARTIDPRTMAEPVAAGPTSLRIGRAPDRAGSTRRLVLVLALIGLAVAATVGAVIAGGLVRDPLRSAPSVVAEASVAPAVTDPTDPGPSIAPVPSSGVATSASRFRSTLYDYELSHPSDWTTEAATSEWDGTGAWDTAPVADVLRPSVVWDANGPWNPRFTVASTTYPEGMPLGAWIASHVPTRVGPGQPTAPDKDRFCTFHRGDRALMVDTAAERWTSDTIGGHQALVRKECGYVDAVVEVGARIYLLSHFSRIMSTGDLAAFRAIADTISFAPSSPPPSPSPGRETTAFTSPRYGFTLELPDYRGDWTFHEATASWDGTGA